MQWLLSWNLLFKGWLLLIIQILSDFATSTPLSAFEKLSDFERVRVSFVANSP
jgi:hypothetical protein